MTFLSCRLFTDQKPSTNPLRLFSSLVAYLHAVAIAHASTTDSAAAVYVHTTNSWQTVSLRIGLGLQSLVAHTGRKVDADWRGCTNAAQFQFAVS